MDDQTNQNGGTAPVDPTVGGGVQQTPVVDPNAGGQQPAWTPQPDPSQGGGAPMPEPTPMPTPMPEPNQGGVTPPTEPAAPEPSQGGEAPAAPAWDQGGQGTNQGGTV